MQHNLCLYCEGKEHKVMICTAKLLVQMQLKQTFFNSVQSEEYFLINCIIRSESTQANTKALIDTDDFSYTFID